MTIPALFGASNESLSDAVQSPSRDRTAIILDWDDTLLCSTWLSRNDLRLDNAHLLSAEHRAELVGLEQRVLRFLERAVALARRVYLVTNAETGWVELSCARFMPGLSGMLDKVKVVSARSTHESKFPGQPSQWKVQAFREELSEFILSAAAASDPGCGGAVANVISIGDSHHEREALYVVTSEWDNLLVKSVKFVERPEPDVLRKQVELIHGCIEYICLHGADLDLMLSHALLTSSSAYVNCMDDEESGSKGEQVVEEIVAANGL